MRPIFDLPSDRPILEIRKSRKELTKIFNPFATVSEKARILGHRSSRHGWKGRFGETESMTSELKRKKGFASFCSFRPAWLGILLFACSAASAQGPSTSSSVAPTLNERFQSDDLSGLALNGFDAVSYFLIQGPQPGSARFEWVWGGAAWRFSSEANREAFKASPDTYAPRLGGYDTESALKGIRSQSDPSIFALVANRLYLFRVDAARERFTADPSLAAAAEEAWLRLQRD